MEKRISARERMIRMYDRAMVSSDYRQYFEDSGFCQDRFVLLSRESVFFGRFLALVRQIWDSILFSCFVSEDLYLY